MFPGNFEYHRPGSVDEAIALLGEHGEDGRVLAGGHSLIPMMKLRFAQPGHLIDLRDVSEVKGIDDGGGEVRLGAMTTMAKIIGSGLLSEKLPILDEAARLIADPQVRSMGTIGGNVANGDPGNDIGAVTPEEIALSVLADIVRERRLGSPAEVPRMEDVLKEINGEAPSPS